MMNWISPEDALPHPHMAVLVLGGCAFWDGEAWHTYMKSGYPEVKPPHYWAFLPTPPAILSERFTYA